MTLLASSPCVQLGDGGARGEFRPALSGPEETVEAGDGRWLIRWTTEGEDAIAASNDGDGNGLPDGVDAIVRGLEEGEAAFADAGWRPILGDEGEGGSDAIDVYVRQIDAFGFAFTEAVDGGFSCYVELDPDNTDLGADVASSVAAHEAHHCVQYAYTVESHSWLYEATATFEQYRVFTGPALDLALGVLWSQRLRGMDQPIDTLGERFEYAGFALLKHWADRGGADAPTALWETLADEPDWPDALATFADARFGESWDATFTEWAVWNLFACGRDDGAHYDPASHPCDFEAISVEVAEIDPADEILEFVHEDGPATALYGELPAGGSADPLELACAVAPNEARATVALVAIGADGAAGEVATGFAADGDVLEVRLTQLVDPDGTIGIVATSTGELPAEIRCGKARVPPLEDEGEGCAGCAARDDEAAAAAATLLPLLLLAGRLRRCTRSSSPPRS